jgi:protocatechuate 3,4-dioxygenase beta subunit
MNNHAAYDRSGDMEELVTSMVILNRRELLLQLGAAGVGAVVAGCGGSGGSQPTPTPTRSATPFPDSTASPTVATTATREATSTATQNATGTTTPTVHPSATPGSTETPRPTETATPSPTPTATATPDTPLSCVLTPQQTEGPFFLDTGLLRRDITESKPGTALRLTLRIVEEDGCVPIRDAVVEIWHADADGTYSGFSTAQGNLANTLGQTYLRGFQVTDDNGRVEFETIYPGWYPGRTAHIHFKVLLDASRLATTQLYFSDALTDVVYMQPPYNSRGPRNTTNATDGIFAQGGASLTLTLTEDGDGYQAAFLIGVLP